MAALGLSGEETKLLDVEKERTGGREEGESGGRRGASILEVVGVRGGWSGLLEPLGMCSSPSLEWDGHETDICRRRPGR